MRSTRSVIGRGGNPVGALPAGSRPSVRKAFEYCEQITRNHYENFPVASLFIPGAQRPYICSIYAFARIADDIADEDSLDPRERLRKLDDWQRKLEECSRGYADDPVFIALAETIGQVGIPLKPLADLLVAFRMDVTTRRFSTFADLLHYCSYSANPVGKLVLHVFQAVTDRRVELSNQICTGLQLANFWQDVANDWQKERIYIPLEDFARFGYTQTDFSRQVAEERFRELMRFEVDRTEQLFVKGKPLLDDVPAELRFELRLTWMGGVSILRKIRAAGYDVLTKRPRNSSLDWLRIVIQSLFSPHA